MRVNLNCQYDDKEHAKRLGAKWDAAAKTWYVVDPPDLLRFSKWLRAYPAQDKPALNQPNKPCKAKKHKKAKRETRPIVEGQTIKKTGPAHIFAICQCLALPWEDCKHTKIGH